MADGNNYDLVELAGSFISELREKQKNEFSIDDLLSQDAELASDRAHLLKKMMLHLEEVKYRNLSKLYSDIMMVRNAVLSRPVQYHKVMDDMALRMLEDRLKIYQEIRGELRDHATAMVRLGTDLIDALLKYKETSQESEMMKGMQPKPEDRLP